MLDPDQVDLDELCTALDDGNFEIALADATRYVDAVAVWIATRSPR